MHYLSVAACLHRGDDGVKCEYDGGDVLVLLLHLSVELGSQHVHVHECARPDPIDLALPTFATDAGHGGLNSAHE